jgi:hypothetical protein
MISKAKPGKHLSIPYRLLLLGGTSMGNKQDFTRREFMKHSALTGAGFAALSGLVSASSRGANDEIRISTDLEMAPRLSFAIDGLSKTLTDVGITNRKSNLPAGEGKGRVIKIATDPKSIPQASRRTEGFSIESNAAGIQVNGFDTAGVLYACQELGSQVRKDKALPGGLNLAEAPRLSMRGVTLFLMTAGTYDYSITESQFPWFYDQSLWTKTLDFLYEQRLNFISLWNSHPFPYFVKLEKYPEVKVLSDDEMERNVALMDWLSHEAEKRNIWLMFHFYNIHLPESFGYAHGFPKSPLWNGCVLSEPDPVAADYTRYAIKEFVQKFPSVGLYVCLGEALQKDQTYWMDEVILAGVKESGKHPPVILRSHPDHDEILRVLKDVKPHYDDLSTEMKHNAEMYAVPEPDPDNAEWIRQSRKHIISVHLMGDLKPFRWGPPSFIQETARDQQRMGAEGVQVYPLWVWYWPYTADRTRLLQVDRDWLWYAAWGRYAWNADRPQDQEEQHWKEKIAERFGANSEADLLTAYESAGRVMPSVPRLFWFDGWNHWFASNGLTLAQILTGTSIPYTNTQKVLSVTDYAHSLAAGKSVPQDGLTPMALTAEMVRNGKAAVEACKKAQALVEKNGDEFARLRIDFEATFLIAQFYQAKIEAAVHYVAYQNSRDAAEGRKVIDLLGRSLEHYRELVRITDKPYPAANDIRNDIPFPFHPPSLAVANGNSIPRLPHWRDLLPVFESELEMYKGLLT